MVAAKRLVFGACLLLVHQADVFCGAEIGSARAGSSTCPVNCLGVRKKPVCASDGRSYPSLCEVQRQRCEGKTLNIVSATECPMATLSRSKEKPEVGASSACLAERERALRQAQDTFTAVRRKPAGSSAGGSVNSLPNKVQVIPECKADGSYQEVQCHAATKYCWCVNPEDGKPVPKSSVQNARPTCGRSRSEERPVDDCTDPQKKEFNANLVKLFMEEYVRLPEEIKKPFEASHEGTTGESGPDAQEQIVLDWKFEDLDRNKDKELQQSEIRNLKKIVKNNVRPKECAKDFVERCDKDQNTEVSRSEWSLCLGRGLEPYFHLFLSLNSDPPVAHEAGWNADDGLPIRDSQIVNENENNQSPPELSSQQKRLHAMLGTIPSAALATSNRDHDNNMYEDGHYEDLEQQPASASADSARRPDENEGRRMRANTDNLISLQKKTCTDMRESSLRIRAQDLTKFVPACQDNGRFQREQCHTTTGHCWCVNEETGLPIQNSVVQKKRPNCTAIAGSGGDAGDEEEEDLAPGVAIAGDQLTGSKSRELPECPNKQAFLVELVDVITRDMVDNGAAGVKLPSSISEDPSISIEEKAIRWKVFRLDKNGNDIIDKKEMKEFRKILNSKKIKSPKKCSRNFVGYCDANQDGRLSVAELLECTDVKAQSSSGRASMNSGDSSNPARGRGTGQQYDLPLERQNPFLYLLKPSRRK